MQFTSTDAYVATDDLIVAVNAAVTVGRPLRVKGEPRMTEVARSLGMPLIAWHIKPTTRDALRRPHGPLAGDERNVQLLEHPAFVARRER